MSAQFLRISCYGRAPRKGQPSWSCIDGTTQEGERLPAACGHVKAPSRPSLLHGVLPTAAGEEAIGRAATAVDAMGRRLRKDGIALLAGVVSYPGERRLLESDIGEFDHYRWWLWEVVDWLKAEFGDHLRSVVEHTDERYPHLHFYVVPTLSAERRLNIHAIHPGYRAKFEAAAEGQAKKAQDAAYRRGMRDLQDRFHAAIGRKFGHSRFGSRRRRIAREVQLEKNRLEEERAKLQMAADREIVEAETAARVEAYDVYADRLRQMTELVGLESERRLAAEHELEALRAKVIELSAERNVRPPGL